MDELYARVRGLDPTLIPDLASRMPAWLGALALLAGLAIAFAGGSRRGSLRVTVAALAALATHLFVDRALDPAALGIPAGLFRGGAAALLAALGLAWPTSAGFVCSGMLGALLARDLVPFGEPWMRLVAGGLLVGVIGASFTRGAAAIGSALAGAAVATLGGCSLAIALGWAGALLKYPVAPLFPLLLLFVSGAAYQLTRPPPSRPLLREKPAEGAA